MFKSERTIAWITVLCIVLSAWAIACLALVPWVVVSLKKAIDKAYEEPDRQMAIVRHSERMIAELCAGTRTECEFDNLDPLIRISKYGPAHDKVQSVRLLRADLSDHLWGLLRGLPFLKEVAIESCEGADTLLAEIAGMNRLEHLSITETFISDEGMKSIASFPRLRELELGRECRGVSPEPLRKHSTLERLTLATIDDHWIDVLKTLPKLTTLDIEDADPDLTPEMIARLTRILPQVKLHRVGPIGSSNAKGQQESEQRNTERPRSPPSADHPDEHRESHMPSLGLLAVSVIWLFHAAVALSLSGPIVLLGRRRVRWHLWELLAVVLPFAVWAVLFVSPLSAERKSVENLVEACFLAIGVPMAALARVAIGARGSQQEFGIALIAFLCIVAAAIFFAVPPLF